MSTVFYYRTRKVDTLSVYLAMNLVGNGLGAAGTAALRWTRGQRSWTTRKSAAAAPTLLHSAFASRNTSSRIVWSTQSAQQPNNNNKQSQNIKGCVCKLELVGIRQKPQPCVE